MPLDSSKVRLAIIQGMSPVCATCEHYGAAQDRGLDSCGKTCGGPIVGMDFPLYKGPMTRLDNFCFACVSRSDFVIKVPLGTKHIGVCNKHLTLLDRMTVKDFPKMELEVRSPQGLIAPVGGRYTPKSLGELFAETEENWRKDG